MKYTGEMKRNGMATVLLTVILSIVGVAGGEAVYAQTVSENRMSGDMGLEGDNTTLQSSEQISVAESEDDYEDTVLPDQDVGIMYKGTDKDLEWTIDKNGHLVVTGSGDYKERDPWNKGFGWLDYGNQIKSASVSVDEITSTAYMFYGCSELTEVDLTKLDTSKVTNMSQMFSECSSLESLDLSGFDTKNVSDMSSMFFGCSGLKNLELSHFNTSKVTGMRFMFYGCSSLAKLDVSGFDTRTVTDMENMFSECSGLKNLELSNFNTSKVTSMRFMFSGCNSLEGLDLSGFDTKNVSSMAGMFSHCSSMTKLDISSFVTSNVSDMVSMFQFCGEVTSLDVSGFDTSNVTNMENMFCCCGNVESLDVSGFDTRKVTNMKGMFSSVSKVTSLDVSGFVTSSVTDMSNMFCGVSKVTSLDVVRFNTGNVTNMAGMFFGCSGLTSLDVKHFDTSNVTNMESMFKDCSGLTCLNVSSFDTCNVTDMSYMFSNCCGLTSLDVSCFNTSAVKRMNGMFGFCSSLTRLDISSFITSWDQDMTDMLLACSNLESISVGKNFSCNLLLPIREGNDIWFDTSDNVCTYVTRWLQYPMAYTKEKIVDLSKDEDVVVEPIPAQRFNGAEIRPQIKVSYKGTVLEQGIHYNCIYQNNVMAGTASVVIVGTGKKYAGRKTVNFTIESPVEAELTFSSDPVSLGSLEYQYAKGNLKKLSTKNYYSLYFDFVPRNNAKEYEIELTKHDGKKLKTVKVNCENMQFVKKTINNLTTGILGVRVRAKRDDKVGKWSEKRYVLKQPRAQARNYNGNIQIKWEKIKGVSQYYVYMCTTRNGKYKKVATAKKNKSMVTIKKYNKKALKNRTYYYYVAAVKLVNRGNSTFELYKSDRNYIYKVKKY